jgi:tetratricopeptide (TPR) repeat protein
MPRRPLALLLALTAVAAADTAPPKKALTAAETKQLAAALAEAHAAEKKGNHAAAAAAYERAVAVQPSDGRVLTELGWQLYQAKDAARAEAVTRQAIAAADGHTGAAALYNLGKILDEKGDKPGAIKAWTESLERRPNHTVMAALTRLDPAAAAAADPLRPRPLDGPFPSLEAWCEKIKPKNGECPFNGVLSTAFESKGGPWLEMKIRSDFLAVRTARGWFIYDYRLEDLLDVHISVSDDYPHTGFNVDTYAQVAELVGGAPPELALERITSVEVWANPDNPRSSYMLRRDKVQGVCGLGSSGVPSCFQLAVNHRGRESDQHPRWWELSLTWGANDVEVRTAGGQATEDASALLGKHPIKFP